MANVSTGTAGLNPEAPKTNGKKVNASLAAVATAPALMALNGITRADAGTMVKAFITDPTTSDPSTNVWFSSGFVDFVYSTLVYEGGDGVRIYFAKKEGKNNLVVVSTKAVQNTANGSTIHQDYFEHNTTVLGTSTVQNTVDYLKSKGANLYTANPCAGVVCNTTAISNVKCTDAKAWVDNFKAGDKINIKAVWYGLKLIKWVKYQLDMAANDGTDGIRIYFVKNTDTGSNGFVIVSTKLDEDGITHNDYYGCNDPGARHSLDVDDHGEECPINCKGTTAW